jgi:hypothetical protein
MKLRAAVTRVLFLAAIAGWTGAHLRVASAQGGAIVWSPNLGLSALTRLTERRKGRESADGVEVLRSSKGKLEPRRVFNCRDYLKALDEGFLVLSTSDLVVERVFVTDCYLLRDLAAAARNHQLCAGPMVARCVDTATAAVGTPKAPRRRAA